MNEHWRRFEVKRGLDTVQPIFDLIQGEGWIAGSYAAFMAATYDTPILPNDVDVFCKTAQGAENIAAKLRKHMNVGSFGFDENDVAYSLLPGSRSKVQMPVQVVKPNPSWKSFPNDILESFDMDICRAVLISQTRVLADSNVAYRQGKLLRINNPMRSLKRVMKYAQRGVTFEDHELLKLFEAWDQFSTERKAEIIAEAKPVDISWSGFWEFDEDDDYFDGE